MPLFHSQSRHSTEQMIPTLMNAQKGSPWCHIESRREQNALGTMCQRELQMEWLASSQNSSRNWNWKHLVSKETKRIKQLMVWEWNPLPYQASIPVTQIYSFLFRVFASTISSFWKSLWIITLISCLVEKYKSKSEGVSLFFVLIPWRTFCVPPSYCESMGWVVSDF